jgi:hypothetical protein
MSKIKTFVDDLEIETLKPTNIFYLENFLNLSKERGATIFEIGACGVAAYIETYSERDETEAERLKAVRAQKDAKELVDRINFQDAKETYFRLKDQYEK